MARARHPRADFGVLVLQRLEPDELLAAVGGARVVRGIGDRPGV